MAVRSLSRDAELLQSKQTFSETLLIRQVASDQKAILDTIAAYQANAPDFPCAEAFVVIYDGTPDGSPARKLLSDMYAHGACECFDTYNAQRHKLIYSSTFRRCTGLEEGIRASAT